MSRRNRENIEYTILMDLKTCTHCPENGPQPLDAFRPGHNRCRECTKAYQRAYYKANRERIRTSQARYAAENRDGVQAQQRRWRDSNVEHRKEYRRAHYEANREDYLEQAKQWASENPERIREHKAKWTSRNADAVNEKSRRYQARKRGATVEKLDYSLIRGRDEACYLCEVSFSEAERFDTKLTHVDHVVPIAKNGPHSYANTALTHARCNLAKGDRLSDRRPQQGG